MSEPYTLVDDFEVEDAGALPDIDDLSIIEHVREYHRPTGNLSFKRRI